MIPESPDRTESLADWEALVSSRGWSLLVAHATHDLDQTFHDKVTALLKDGGDLDQIRQLAAIRDYVLKDLLVYPRREIERFRRLETAPAIPRGQRRGPNL